MRKSALPPRTLSTTTASDGDGPAAGGLPSVVSALRHVVSRVGVIDGARVLLQMNQHGGFDCPGCAWPDPEPRGMAEFCENGAKHVSHEATRRRVTPEFFARHSIHDLRQHEDSWLEGQGRLTEPMWKPQGASHYQPIAWEQAFQRIGSVLRGLQSPDEAVFYTSGRTGNEAAFLWQLFARRFGTNNLPDCSNLCHESSGTGLGETIGVGKGTVDLADFELADAIFVIGQNPGTNHPRMMTTLRAAAQRGCDIVSINPLRERSLVRFSHPQHPRDLLTDGTAIATLHLPVRVGGDVALLQAISREVLDIEATAPRHVLDHDFIARHCDGFEAWRTALEATPQSERIADSGVAHEDIRRAAGIYARSERVIICWAMGLTQHRHGVANVREIVNLLLLRGNIGRPGAGPCPVRGHSNVQGDRTMGIVERPRPEFLDALGREFQFVPPRKHGLDSVGAIEAMYAGSARVFVGLGGNFAVATPDPDVVATALGRCRLTAQISTTLNRSHLTVGDEALILPCLVRSERDASAAGTRFVTVEDSMSVVRRSEGMRPPASPHLRSEVAIVAEIARETLGEADATPWSTLAEDYDRIRDSIARVVPGFSDFNVRVRRGPFALPRAARERRFDTPSGRARFTVNERPPLTIAPGRLWLTTLRSHEQFNTTVYGQDDRYRGVRGGRRVLLIHADDLRGFGFEAGALVDVTSHFGSESRIARGFRLITHSLPRGCVAAYYPEANALIPVSCFAEGSRTPSYKSIEITLERAQA